MGVDEGLEADIRSLVFPLWHWESLAFKGRAAKPYPVRIPRSSCRFCYGFEKCQLEFSDSTVQDWQ